MATITDIRPIDLYWLACNYNQGMLETLYNGGDASGVISPFKYTNNKSTSTNLHDIFFNINVDHYTDARFGEYEAHGVSINYRMRDAQIQEIEARGKEISEIVIYYSGDNELTYADINLSFDDISQKTFYAIDPGNRIGYFKVMIKFTDNTISDFSINWGLDLLNCTYSNYRDEVGDYVDGFPWVIEGDRVQQSFGWINGNNDSKGSVDGLYGNYEQKTSFMLSHKTFQSHADALAYLKYGIDNSLEEDDGESGEPAEDRITTLFYASNIYSRAYNDSNLQRLGASTIYIDIQYARNDGTIIVDKNRAICGYVNTNNAVNDENHFGNIIWMAANNVKILETKQSWLNGGFADTQTLPNFANTTGFYGPLIDGNTIYESRYNTNMRIFANRADAEEFLRGGNPTPIAGGTNAGQFNPDKLVGDPTVYNNPSADISADMSSCWILTKSEVDELANILATGLTSQESEENGILVNTLLTTGRSFSAHAEPIDAIVDLFWLPFNPREFSNNDYDHLVFAEDKYCSFEALGEAVDAAGQAVKGAYSNPVGRAFLPGGVFVNAYESGKAVGEKIASVIDVGETLNKFNIVSNMRDGMN